MEMSTDYEMICNAQPATMGSNPERILALCVIAHAVDERDTAFFFNTRCADSLQFWCEAAGLNVDAVREAQRGRFKRDGIAAHAPQLYRITTPRKKLP